MGAPSEKTDPKQAAGRFKKGQSGNPAGKPKGTRHALTVLAEKLMADDAEEVTKAVIEKAKSGDMVAARLVLDRIVPIRRGRPIQIDLPKVSGTAEVLEAQGRIVAAVAAGELTTDEGAALADILEAKRRAIETMEIESRIAALEAKEDAKR